MLTKNYKILKMILDSLNTRTLNNELRYTDYLIKTTTGDLYYTNFYNNSTSGYGGNIQPLYYPASVRVTTDQTYQGSGLNGIVLGSGNTIPTEEDYKLEQPIGGFSATSISTNIIADSDKIQLNHTFGITNTSGSSITIAEIGYFTDADKTQVCNPANGNRYGSGYSTQLFHVLLSRDLLDSALVIPAGESATINNVVTFPGYSDYFPS